MEVTGYIAAGLTCILWGTYGVFVKLVDTYDGFAFQWFQINGIMLVGAFSLLIIERYEIYPIAMIGGSFWCFGNLTLTSIVNKIGLVLGSVIWGLINLIVGWTCGKYGIFVDKETIHHPWINIVGLISCIISGIFYLRIKTNCKIQKPYIDKSLVVDNSISHSNHSDSESCKSLIDSQHIEITNTKNYIGGILLSITAGILYGLNMIPVKYLQDKTGIDNPFEFVFSHFFGALLTSTLIVLIYCLMNNNPIINHRNVVPGIISGILWGLGQCCGFLANKRLGLTVAFPLIACGPGIVCSLWGIFVFKEIRGIKNYVFFIIAGILSIGGIGLISYSKF